jgi:hypothetical protein
MPPFKVHLNEYLPNNTFQEIFYLWNYFPILFLTHSTSSAAKIYV